MSHILGLPDTPHCYIFFKPTSKCNLKYDKFWTHCLRKQRCFPVNVSLSPAETQTKTSLMLLEVLINISPSSKVSGCSPVTILELTQIFLGTQLHFCGILTQCNAYISFIHYWWYLTTYKIRIVQIDHTWSWLQPFTQNESFKILWTNLNQQNDFIIDQRFATCRYSVFQVVGETLKANLFLYKTTVLNGTVAYGFVWLVVRGFFLSKRQASAYKKPRLSQFV